MKDLPYGARVKDLDGREGTVVAISKDGGKFRLVKWDDGSTDSHPREELTRVFSEQEKAREATALLNWLISRSESEDWQNADSFVALTTDDETHRISLSGSWTDPVEAMEWAEKHQAELNRGAPADEIPYVVRVFPMMGAVMTRLVGFVERTSSPAFAAHGRHLHGRPRARQHRARALDLHHAAGAGDVDPRGARTRRGPARARAGGDLMASHDLEKTPCPVCGALALRIEERLTAKPIGTYSLAGAQMKVSVLVPWLVCGSCGAAAEGKR